MTLPNPVADVGPGGPARLAGQVHQGRRDRGAATAELAAGLPVVVLLLLFGLIAIGAVTARLQCVDAAREAARVAARGGDGAIAGQAAAPEGAEVSVTVQADRVVATVRSPVPLLGTRLPRLVVTGSAVAAAEPGPPRPAP